jgi:hypothetical protein
VGFVDNNHIRNSNNIRNEFSGGTRRFQRLLFPGLAAAAPPAYKNGQLRL